MPVFVPEQEDPVGPYRRLSASQINLWDACPRQWFLEKVRRLRIAQTPPLHLGRAVEAAVCLTLRESPGLIVARAPSNVLGGTPLDEEDRPDQLATTGWPADGLLPLQARPSSVEEVRTWAYARAALHLPKCLAEERSAWDSHERKSGSWEQRIDPKAALRMVERAIDLHLEELEACLALGGGPSLEAWRAGERPAHPAPDGRRFAANGAHPLAVEGPCDVLEAWEITRPWFVDPDAGSFTSQAVHPSFRFQGEYDLVYRWRGGAEIVDLKASVGASDRTSGYHEQLRAYAALWRATHDGSPLPGRLSIWFLGTGDVVDVDVPSHAWCEEFEARFESLWEELRDENPDEASCPPQPAPYRNHSHGGVFEGVDDDLLKRCTFCDWQVICPGPDGELPDLPRRFQLPGHTQTTNVDSLGDINPRVDLHLEVNSVQITGVSRPRVLFTDGQRQAEMRILGRNTPEGMNLDVVKGQRVRLTNVMPEIGRGGRLTLRFDPRSTLEPVEDGALDSLMVHQPARVDVVGRVAYRFEKHGLGRNGRPWSRCGLMLIDSTGTMKIDGWSNAMPRAYGHVEAGDVVAFTNLSPGAWVDELQGDISDVSDLRVLARADEASTA